MAIKNDFSSTALTGLDAASYSLSLISNNIANVNTSGYKSAGANFYELLSSGSVGSGVQAGNVQYSFEQGAAVQTGVGTNMMISGEGFFNVKDPGTGQLYYSRSGAFTLQDGYLVNEQGYHVQGFQGTSQSGATSDIQISQTPLAPSATANVNFTGNLNPATNNGASQTVTFYDAAGNSHTLGVSFNYNSTSKLWGLSYTVDGTAQPQTPAQTMGFDASGNINSGQTQTVNTGAGTLNLSLAGMTGYGGSNMTGPTATADGYPAGTYSNFTVEQGGVIVEKYTNGQTKQVGSIALSSFFINGALQNAGGGNWTASSGVGTVTTGVSGSAGLGDISTGQLEGSNVNLSNQVVDMISAQRDFQSDAQVLKVGKLLDQTVLNIDN